tara:strand:+ start:515 stop:802 length:288 start_codon:yes stop_codon:yes gene_type:complete
MVQQAQQALKDQQGPQDRKALQAPMVLQDLQAQVVLLDQPDLLVLQVLRDQQALPEQTAQLGVQEVLTRPVALMVTFTLKQILIRYGRNQVEVGA